MLAAHGLADGDRLICRSGPDGLHVMSHARAAEHLRARARARARMPDEADLIDLLLGGGTHEGGSAQAP